MVHAKIHRLKRLEAIRKSLYAIGNSMPNEFRSQFFEVMERVDDLKVLVRSKLDTGEISSYYSKPRKES